MSATSAIPFQKELKKYCSLLRSSKTTERKVGMKELNSFFDRGNNISQLHQQAETLWGNILSHILHAVKADFYYVQTKKLKFREEYLRFLKKILSLADQNGPKLHFSASGQKFLLECIRHGMEILQDENIAQTFTGLEYWNMLDLVFQHRVYCEILTKRELHKLLQGCMNTIHLLMQTGGNRALTIQVQNSSAKVMHTLLKNSWVDIVVLLNQLMSFFAIWFENATKNMDTRMDSVSRKLLEALNTLLKRYASLAFPLVNEHGPTVLRFVQRSWKLSSRHLRDNYLEYLILHLQIIFHHEQLLGEPMLRKGMQNDLRGLYSSIVEQKEMSSMLGQASLIENRIGSSYSLKLDNPALLYFSLASDIMFYIDQQKKSDDSTSFAPTDDRYLKRQKFSTAWETLVDNILYIPISQTNQFLNTQDCPTSANYSQFNLSVTEQTISQQNLASLKNNNSKKLLPWIALLTFYVTRHPKDFRKKSKDVIERLILFLGGSLTTNEISTFHVWCLRSLLQLSFHVRSFSLYGPWNDIWKALLRADLPYRNATLDCSSNCIGELILKLLTNCIFFDLVSTELLFQSQESIWKFPILRNISLDCSEIAPFFIYIFLNKVELQQSSNRRPSVVESLNAPFLTSDSSWSNFSTSEDMSSSKSIDLLQFIFNNLYKKIFHSSSGNNGELLFNFASALGIHSILYPGCSIEYGFSLISNFSLDVSAIGLKITTSTCSENRDTIVTGFGVDFCNHEVQSEIKYNNSSLNADFVIDSVFQIYMGEIETTALSSKVPRFFVENALLQLDLLQPVKTAILTFKSTTSQKSNISNRIKKDLDDFSMDYISFMLKDIASRLCTTKKYSAEFAHAIDGFLEVGLLISTLHGYISKKRNSFDTVYLLKSFFSTFSEYFCDKMLLCDTMQTYNIRFLNKFYLILLFMQGKSVASIKYLVGRPIDLIVPVGCRSSLRRIAQALDGFMQRPKGYQQSAMESSDRLFEDSNRLSTADVDSESGASSQISVNDFDFMDGNSVSVPSIASSFSTDDVSFDSMQYRSGGVSSNELLDLWCARLFVILKHTSSNCISALEGFVDIRVLNLDSLLAVSKMLCAIPSHQSESLMFGILDHVVTISPNNVLIHTQVLRVLKLFALNYSDNVKGFEAKISSSTVMNCHQLIFRGQNNSILQSKIDQYAVARLMEVQCVRIFFLLDTDSFPEFVELLLAALIDDDAEVRYWSSQSLSALFYMYPDGESHVYDDIFSHLQQYLPELDSQASSNPIKASTQPNSLDEIDCILQESKQISSLLALAICAASASSVVNKVLFYYTQVLTIKCESSAFLRVVVVLLEFVSKFRNYSSKDMLLLRHFPFILRKWMGLDSIFGAINENYDIAAEYNTSDQFDKLSTMLHIPCGLFSALSFNKFLQQQKDVVVPLICIFSSIEVGENNRSLMLILSFIADDSIYAMNNIQINIKKEISQCVPNLAACLCILFSVRKTKALAKKVMENVIVILTASSHFYGQITEHTQHVVHSLAYFYVIDLLGINPTSSTWSVGIKYFCKMLHIKEGILLSRLNVIELLVFLHNLITSSSDSFILQRGLLILQDVIEMLEKHQSLKSLPVQTLLLHMLLQYMEMYRMHQDLLTFISNLLLKSCGCFLKTPELMGKNLNKLIFGILSLILPQPRNSLNLCSDGDSQTSEFFQPLCPSGSESRANLDAVLYSFCNNTSQKLTKYISKLELGPYPKKVSVALDKLHSLTKHVSCEDNMRSIFFRKKFQLNLKTDPNLTNKIEIKLKKAIRFMTQFVSQYYESNFAHVSKTVCSYQLQYLRKQIRLLHLYGMDLSEYNVLYRKLVYSLLQLSGEDCSLAIKLEIASCLGQIGAVSFFNFDLSPGVDINELDILHRHFFGRSCLGKMTKHVMQTARCKMLEWLLDSLYHKESTISYCAVSALKKILSTETGKNAFNRVSNTDFREHLLPFVGECDPNKLIKEKSKSDSGKAPLPNWAKLWEEEKQDFSSWICRVTSFLLKQCNDVILQESSEVASMNTDLARYYFPYSIWNLTKPINSDGALCINDDESPELKQMKQYLSSQFHLVLASKDENKCCFSFQCHQLVISTLNFLKETNKLDFMENSEKRVDIIRNLFTGKKKTTAQSYSSSMTPDEILMKIQKHYSCVLDLDLLDIAETAIQCNMPYSGMQYIEMWVEHRNTKAGDYISCDPTADITMPVRWKKLFVEAYQKVNEPDGIYGVNNSNSLDSQLVAYTHEGNFGKCLPLYDVLLQDKTTGSIKRQKQYAFDLASSLRMLGYHHLLRNYLTSYFLEQRKSESAVSSKSSWELQEYQYEMAWRNSEWNFDGMSVSSSCGRRNEHNNIADIGFNRSLHECLIGLVNDDTPSFQVSSAQANSNILGSVECSLYGLESTKSTYQSLSRLLHLAEVEDVLTYKKKMLHNPIEKKIQSSQIESPIVGDNNNDSFMKKYFRIWTSRHSQLQEDFDLFESLLNLENVLLQHLGFHDLLFHHYLQLIKSARKANRIPVAYSALHKLEALQESVNVGDLNAYKWRLEKARILWKQGESVGAISATKKLCDDIAKIRKDESQIVNMIDLDVFYISVLRITGNWLATERSESSQHILDNFLGHAVNLIDKIGDVSVLKSPCNAVKAYLSLGNYMAEMFQHIDGRVKSKEWLAGKAVALSRQKELRECRLMSEIKQKENRQHIFVLEKEVNYDSQERGKIEQSVFQFLHGALINFGNFLMYSPDSDLTLVFRILNLWFNNLNYDGIHDVLSDIVKSVPSYKFVPLSYQIISRLGSQSTSSAFHKTLQVLITRLCEQHPHHALIQLIALRNGGNVEGKGAAEYRVNIGEEKLAAAAYQLELLRRNGAQLDLIESLQILSNAYIQLALFDTQAYHKMSRGKIPLSNIRVHGGTSFDQCLRDRNTRDRKRTIMPCVITKHIDARPDMDYSNVVKVLSFEPTFSITDSGIHRPKIIHCCGTDGRLYKQLVKGQDDTRQDVVIEQVFETVNTFLNEDSSTRERKLRIQTYKVIPLSPVAGVLEWVENTVPLGSYLIGRGSSRPGSSAHERYHPHEWKHAECRQYLKSASDKHAAYQVIEKNFTPVFHHFFLEKFPDPAVWFHRRTAYIRSVAVTSIIGYILGIGDRHSQNILIHQDTAELVHIDFGVVFDQGMALFTPETVPFRLTRDMVDGMGVAGCEGIFNRCCEESLKVLRRKTSALVTILEVIIHDPLYRWTLSPIKALRIQGETAKDMDGDEMDTSNKEDIGLDAAGRALIRLKQKLQGYEDPNGNALSIEGQVKRLVYAAQDSQNLCRLFHGWAPWL